MHGTTLVVLSDAHLGDAPSDVTEAFLAFLDIVPTLGDSLLINGDLFDFWFVYRHVMPRHGFHVAAALTRLARKVNVAMVGGNHDRWGDNFWPVDAGIAFDPVVLRFQVGSRAVLAMHGDGLTETRPSARLLHRLIASRVTVGAFRLLHPDLAYSLVKRLAPHLGDEPKPNAQVLEVATQRQSQWAQQRFAEQPGLGLIVMGHTHQAALVHFDAGHTYLNPGAWFDGYRYAVATESSAELRTYSA